MKLNDDKTGKDKNLLMKEQHSQSPNKNNGQATAKELERW